MAREHLVVLGLYLLPTLYLLARVLPRFGSVIPGGPVADIDGWQNVWNLWWVQHALSRGENPFFTSKLFYPVGVSLYLQTLNITNGLLTLPVQLLAGPVAAYNAAAALGFVLSGYGVYLLGRRVVGHRGASFVAGALYTFSPFHLTKLWDGQLEWIALQWIPFYVFWLLRAIETGRARWRILAGLAFFLLALTSWYCALFSVVFSGLLVLVRLPAAWHAGRWRNEVATLLSIGGVSGLLLAPVFLGASEFPASSGSRAWDPAIISHSADLLDFLLPSSLHPLFGGIAVRVGERLHPHTLGWNIAPGFGLLLLSAAGGWGFWRQARPWIILTIALFLLALGPRLHVAGVETSIVLPYALLWHMPGIVLARRPNHFVVLGLLSLALLAALGVRALLAHGRRGQVGVGLLLVLVMAEYMVAPLPVLPFRVDPIFRELRDQQGAIVEVPLDIESAAMLRNQVVHHRPIVGGFLARTPDNVFVRTVPGLRDLWDLDAQPNDVDIIPGQELERQVFSYYGLRTIMLDHARLHPDREERARQVIDRILPGAQAWQSNSGIAVYQVPPVAMPRPFLYLGQGWQPLERDENKAWRWMAGAAEAHIVNPGSDSILVTLELQVSSYQRLRPLWLQLGERSIASLEVVPGPLHRSIRLGMIVPPGDHLLRLSSIPESKPDEGKRALSLSFTHIGLVSSGGTGND